MEANNGKGKLGEPHLSKEFPTTSDNLETPFLVEDRCRVAHPKAFETLPLPMPESPKKFLLKFADNYLHLAHNRFIAV